MRRSLIVAILVCIGMSVMAVDAFALFKRTKVTLVVIDEERNPIEGAIAGIGFEENIGWGTDVIPQDKLTDGEGKATFSGKCNGHIAYGAEKEGYYSSYYDYDFNDLGTFGWKPWNPELQIVMRKIENPVPMYARNTKFSRLEVPAIGEKVGFDLVLFDWMPPYGKGQHTDFILQVDRSFTDVDNFEEKLTVTFPNKHDGIQAVSETFSNGSVFKLPRNAPSGGYENLLETKSSKENGKHYESFNLNDNYIFRIRSEVKADNVQKAMYGKIHGPFIVTGIMKKKPKIIIQYYLNPDHTRNLEFDPNRNLFADLTDLEQVGIR